MPALVESSAHFKAKNLTNFYAFLVQITVFRLSRISCLRFSKLFPRWFRKLHWWFSPLFFHFYHCLKKIKSSIQTITTTTYSLLDFVKRVSKWPTTQIALIDLHLLYIINVQIVKTRKGLDTQRLSLWLTQTNSQVLCIVFHSEKYFIYIYGDKKIYIAIPIRSQYQQMNMIPVSVRSCTCYIDDEKGNLLAWKMSSPTSLYSAMNASIVRSSGSSCKTWEMSPGPILEG